MRRLSACGALFGVTMLASCNSPQVAKEEGSQHRAKGDQNDLLSKGTEASSLPEGKAVSHCASPEKDLFACKVAGSKWVSICQIDLEGQAGFAQYRFGKAGVAPELIWPDRNTNDRLTFANVMYSGGGESQLSFIKGGYRYIAYGRVVRTNFKAGQPNDSKASAGVAVLRNGELVAELPCIDETGGFNPFEVEPLSKRDDNAFRYHVERDWAP